VQRLSARAPKNSPANQAGPSTAACRARLITRAGEDVGRISAAIPGRAVPMSRSVEVWGEGSPFPYASVTVWGRMSVMTSRHAADSFPRCWANRRLAWRMPRAGNSPGVAVSPEAAWASPKQRVANSPHDEHIDAGLVLMLLEGSRLRTHASSGAPAPDKHLPATRRPMMRLIGRAPLPTRRSPS
jgi:hypothetical protein